jgi:hypothetical protein
LPYSSVANGCYALFIDSTNNFSFGRAECNKSEFSLASFRRKKIENIGKMTQMTQDEIVTNTKTVLQGLEALRVEHMSIIAGLTEGKKDPDKADIIQKNIEDIELGLGEAQVKGILCSLATSSQTLPLFQVIVVLASHLQNIEAEKQKLRT